MPVDRRRFLLGLTAGLPVIAALLAACRGSSSTNGSRGIRMASKEHPVQLPLFDDLPPIADRLSPERHARLTLFGWGPTYFSSKLLSSFEERHGCSIEFMPFRTMEAAIARIRAGAIEADIFVPTIKVLGRLAAARQLLPLNYGYIPHSDNVWRSMISPFYDVGPRYTVPYFVWTTGIAWRNDIVKTDPRDMHNPYDIFWDPANRDHVHLLNSVQDLIGMALLRIGVSDPNTGNSTEIARARDSLLDMVDAVHPELDSSDYHDLFSGAANVHQSWSGNLSYARHYAPRPADVRKLSYFWPPEAGTGLRGLTGNDVLTVLAGAKNPVLAHHFIDFLLEPDNAYENSAYNGYQAPVQSVTADRLVGRGDVPANLSNIIVTQENFALGAQELELDPATDALFHDAYAAVEDEIAAVESASV